jgi:hypothetical protein
VARDFNGSSQYLDATLGSGVIIPLSIFMAFTPDSFSNFTHNIISLGASGNTSDRYVLTTNPTGFAQYVVIQNNNSTSVVGATALSAGTTYRFCAVSASSTDHRVYLDGVLDGSNSGSRNPGTRSFVRIGARTVLSSGTYFDGRIAEVAIWNVALTDAENAALGRGVSPLLIRPQNLVFYAPLLGRADPEPDLSGGANLTLVNNPPPAVHPRVIYPAAWQVRKSATGPSPVSIAPEDCAHGQTAETPAISVGLAVAPADASHAQTADQPGLLQTHWLAPGEGLHAHAADAAALVQQHSLAPGDAAHAHDAASPGLAQLHLMAPSNSTHAHAADAALLNYGPIVTPPWRVAAIASFTRRLSIAAEQRARTAIVVVERSARRAAVS